MNEVKKAIFARLSSDAAILAKVKEDGFGNPRVYYSRPDLKFDAPQITYFLVTSGQDENVPRREEIYQFDVWSADPDLNDAIAARIHELFHRQPLPATGVTVAAFLLVNEQDLFEEEVRVHHKMLQYQVLSFATG